MYDAQTGFHDIKPLPHFSPLPFGWIAAAAAVFLVILGGWLIYRRRSLQTVRQEHRAAKRPEVQALDSLEELEKLRAAGKIDLRELALRLSRILRDYLEAAFAFPASDLTPFEIDSVILQPFKRKMPTLPAEMLEEFRGRTASLLRFCEFAAFASRAELLYPADSDKTSQQMEQGRMLVRELSHRLKKEQERVQGVVAQSRLAQGHAAQPPEGAAR